MVRVGAGIGTEAAHMLRLANRGVRMPFFGVLLAMSIGLSGCFDVSARSSGMNFKVKAKQVRNEIKVIRPGELGLLFEKYPDEKLRYVAYRSLEGQRDRLRAGRTNWAALDVVALMEQAQRDMNAEYQPLRAVARDHFIWARLEGIEPGQLVAMMDGPHATKVANWISNFNAAGRPNVEGRLNRHDFAALQRYAMERLPSERNLLRWTFEQDKRPGQVAGFLGRQWTDAQLKEIMRMWCSAEGWSPLAHSGALTEREQTAVKVAFDRLAKSTDPLTRREAKRWSEWFEGRLKKIAKLR